jgi:carbonic anhydrase
MATIEELHRPKQNQSPNLKAIVDRIRPGVAALVSHDAGGNEAALEQSAMRANILASVNQLRRGSTIIEGLIDAEGLRVVGAWYSLDTGVVQFLEETL